MAINLNNISLSSVYSRRLTDRDIFQDLMPFKVKDLLLVATHYDAYAIVREGKFYDHVFGEYMQLNLFTAPRITTASTTTEALDAVNRMEFQMVIVMAGLDMTVALETASKIKQKNSQTSILLLINNNADLFQLSAQNPFLINIDKTFVWNGDSRVFVAMIKYVEDKMNLPYDTKLGDVRVILLVEDSEKYYSRYLPLLYSIVMNQTQALMSEDTSDQTHKMLKMRVRPKILLVSTYEEAVAIVDNYLHNLICVISDVRFNKDGYHDPDAGIELISYVNQKATIPCLLQSSDASNAEKAHRIGSCFIDKNADNLSFLISKFINEKLGFGAFEFTNARGAKIATANNLREFIQCLETVPAESLLHHAKQNGISTWLMARGEIKLAQCLRPYQIEDFDSSNMLRQTILKMFETVRLNRLKGRVINFDPELINEPHFITRLGDGSFGGKGRGVAFLSNFIENIDFEKLIPNLTIAIPATAIIGTAEYVWFLDNNNINHQLIDKQSDEEIKKLFINARLSDNLTQLLKSYLNKMTSPIAVRSSGLFEDSLIQPFAGVYATYLLPNNHNDLDERLKQLSIAIKLVYASVFSKNARAYFKAVNYKVEQEQMAIILQELVGNRIGDRYYPNISGVAQSYNYYPFGYMKPSDGFAVTAVGLGKYVAGGDKAYRFCPKHPKLQNSTIADQIKDSQSYFYALSLNQADFDSSIFDEDVAIVKLPISDAEEDGNLKHCAQVFDYHNQRLSNDFTKRGPRLVNFANILQYDLIPIPETLDLLLRFFNEAMGAPVEIEFAIDLEPKKDNKPSLVLLQIKPLIRTENNLDINLNDIEPSKVMLKSAQSMGNGCIETISDVIYMDTTQFDRTKTTEMALEISQLNEQMVSENRPYMLIGPGRWGTHDKFTGIPVEWANISKAKVIVEMGLEGYPLEASLGSHFFHNVTSMNVGYFSISYNSNNNWIDFNKLNEQQTIQQTKFFKHVRFNNPLTILMNGRDQKALVLVN